MMLVPLLIEAVKQRGGAAVWTWVGLMLATWLTFAYGTDRPLKGTELVGVAFFDTHVVRTQQETAMVAISPKGAILRVEVIRFQEPEEYAAPERWKDQLKGQTLSPKLSLKADIRPLSGASLTAQALVDASRRALAEFEVLGPKAPP